MLLIGSSRSVFFCTVCNFLHESRFCQQGNFDSAAFLSAKLDATATSRRPAAAREELDGDATVGLGGNQVSKLLRALGLRRFAIVQPSYYGTDNRCMLDGLDALGDRARGVAMVDDEITDAALHALHERGVRALRLDLFLRAQWPTADIVAYVHRSIQRIRPLGWHVQFYTPGYVVRELIPHLAGFEADFVIDHMGYMLASDGLTRSDFDRLIDAMRASGRGWMKLSGPYRVAKDGNFERLRPLAEAIVDALGERTIWGSDWPHIPNGQMDTVFSGSRDDGFAIIKRDGHGFLEEHMFASLHGS